MQRTLSSPLTFLWKFAATPLLIGCLACLLAAQWNARRKNHAVTPDDGRTMATTLVVVAATGAWLVWLSARLKRVAVDDNALHVSNFVTEIRIPLSDVIDVRERGNAKWFVIGIDLRHPTTFGQRIVFRPKLRLYWSGLHPVTQELKTLVEQAKAKQVAETASRSRPVLG